MNALIIVTCDWCGKRFTPGNKSSGVPNGIGMQFHDGRIFNVCADCMMDEDTIKAITDKLEEEGYGNNG